jgi:hypothetical protein
MDGIIGDYQLKIYNILGQKMISQNLNIKNKEIIPLKLNLSDGFYQLIISNETKYYTIKFIIN